MISKPLRIDELKKIFIESTRKLDKNKLANECMIRYTCYDPVLKDVRLSKEAKAKGDKLYSQKDLSFAQFYEILILFNESIALAPKDSKELATAYANKSAVLMRMRKYQECITEIDKALKITESMPLKIKLLCRKAECLSVLGSSDSRSCFEKAKFVMTKLEDSGEEILMLSKLINKTQSALDKGKLDIPKEDKRKMQVLQRIAQVEDEEESVWESVRMEYSEKYGRHLVAARDFDPGEIILIDKPYLNNLDETRTYQYCNQCFNHLWMAVPCDHCSRHLYCSENCKIEAWDEYHEMECFALSCMITPLELRWNKHLTFLVSIFFKALKEAGSIEQLAADSEVSNECQDHNANGVSNLDFTSYKSIFSLPIIDIQREHLQGCIENSITVLIGLAKYTKILGKSYDFKNVKKLVKDDAAILVGVMLLKLTIILGGACPTAHLVDPNELENLNEESGMNARTQFNHSLCVILLHALSGCISNVESSYTYGNKFVLYALQPIKAGDQLITHSRSVAIWDKTTISEMQSFHRKIYGFPCECQACTENWSDTLNDMEKLGALLIAEMQYRSIRKLWNENNSIVSDWTANREKFSFPDIKILFRSMDLVTAAWGQLSMPSPIVVRSVSLLIKISRAFFDPSEIYAKVTRLRKLKIGTIIDPSNYYRLPPKE